MAQFASLKFWQEPVAFGSLILVLLALNTRQVFTGAALTPWLKRIPWKWRIISLAFLSDPNFADSQSSFQHGENDVGVFLGGGLILWLCWVAGTAIGVFGGDVIGDPSVLGIDVVMACFFMASIAGKLGQGSAVLPLVVAGATAIALLTVLPFGWNIVLGALVGAFAGVIFHAE